MQRMPHKLTNTEKNWLRCSFVIAAGDIVGFSSGAVSALWPVAAMAAFFSAVFSFGFGVTRWWTAGVFFAAASLSMHGEERARSALEEMLSPECGRPRTVELVAKTDARVRVGRDGRRWMSFTGDISGNRVKAILPCGEVVARAGDVWQCGGWLAAREPENGRPRTFVARGKGTFARRKGRSILARACARMEPIRDAAAKRMRVGMEGREDVAALNRSILLGGAREMSYEERRVFATAGTSHVFAVSGLHVMVAAYAISAVLSVLGVPRRFQAVLVAPALGAYVALVGAPPSAVRAFSMATLYYSAPMFWRRPSAIAAVSITFLAAHLFGGRAVMDPGAAFSFAVTFALAAFFSSRKGAGRERARIRDALKVSAVAWYAGLPVSVAVFGKIALVGILANCAVVPVATVALLSDLAGVVAGGCCPAVAAHFNNLAALATAFMRDVSAVAASVPFSSVEVPRWPAWVSIAWYALPYAFLKCRLLASAAPFGMVSSRAYSSTAPQPASRHGIKPFSWRMFAMMV